MENFNCCQTFDLTCDNGDASTTQTTVCKPCPTRVVLRIRNLFTCVKKPRDSPKRKGTKRVVTKSASVYNSPAEAQTISPQ